MIASAQSGSPQVDAFYPCVQQQWHHNRRINPGGGSLARLS